jgi:hypothetical protein
MFDWLKRLTGEGTLCFEVEGVDQNGKQMEGTAKLPYIGSLATADMDDLYRRVKLECRMKNGITVTRVKYLGDL